MMRKKWTYVIIGVVVIVGITAYFNRGALAMMGFDWFVQGHVEKKLEKTYQPVDRQETFMPVNTTSKKNGLEPFSILLLGVDQRGKEIGRSDTIIYTVVRPSDGNLLMVSIPRDTYTEIVGHNSEDKINHAFAFGGAGMSMDSVEKLLDSPVNHYASINFEGFRDVIDAMGGISLPIEKDIVNREPGHEYFVIKGGQDLYNGKDALNFTRYREDAGGDINRTERHQQFLSAIMDKAKEMKQWTKIPELIEIMGNNFNTDIRPDKLVDLAQNMLQSKRHIYSHTLTGEGHRLESGGAWYFFADKDDLKQVQLMIRNWLDADTLEANLVLPEKYAAEKESKSQSLTSAADRTE